MTTVVDASALVDFLAGTTTPVGKRLLTDELIAPDIVLAETANGLRRLERRGALGTRDAVAALQDLLDAPIMLVPPRTLLERAYSFRSNVTVHDACYVALAEARECRLVTADRRLAAAVNACGIDVPVVVT